MTRGSVRGRSSADPPPTLRHDTSERHLWKYRNQNPIHRLALVRFFDRVAEELDRLQPRKVFEFGCGEGYFLREMRKRGVSFEDYVGLDLRADALQTARSLHPDLQFVRADLFEWSPPGDGFDVIIASQVLEHIPQPRETFERLIGLCSGYILLTVPLEPWFRILNFLRGRDLRRMGNHPEHVNLWTFRGFRRFVSGGAEEILARRIFPFTLVIARPVDAVDTRKL